MISSLCWTTADIGRCRRRTPDPVEDGAHPCRRYALRDGNISSADVGDRIELAHLLVELRGGRLLSAVRRQELTTPQRQRRSIDGHRSIIGLPVPGGKRRAAIDRFCASEWSGRQRCHRLTDRWLKGTPAASHRRSPCCVRRFRTGRSRLTADDRVDPVEDAVRLARHAVQPGLRAAAVLGITMGLPRRAHSRSSASSWRFISGGC
jgi:hypothetical protein